MEDDKILIHIIGGIADVINKPLGMKVKIVNLDREIRGNNTPFAYLTNVYEKKTLIKDAKATEF